MHTAPARALPTAAAQPSLRGTAAHLRRLLSSHVLVSVVGLGAMPFLARNLGSAGYGRFSLPGRSGIIDARISWAKQTTRT